MAPPAVRRFRATSATTTDTSTGITARCGSAVPSGRTFGKRSARGSLVSGTASPAGRWHCRGQVALAVWVHRLPRLPRVGHDSADFGVPGLIGKGGRTLCSRFGGTGHRARRRGGAHGAVQINPDGPGPEAQTATSQRPVRPTRRIRPHEPPPRSGPLPRRRLGGGRPGGYR